MPNVDLSKTPVKSGSRYPGKLAETGWYSDEDVRVTFDDGGLHFTRRDGGPL